MSNGDRSIFPTQEFGESGRAISDLSGGLTKREYVAVAMMQAIIEGSSATPGAFDDMLKLASTLAVKAADALLAELSS